MLTITRETIQYGVDDDGGRCHDLLGSRCDPYVTKLLMGETFDFNCHANLTRAVLPWHLNESDVHDVLNIFQVTGLDADGRYFMKASPARKGDYFEFLAEIDLLCAISTCPGGDLSVPLWGPEAGDPLADLQADRHRGLRHPGSAARGVALPSPVRLRRLLWAEAAGLGQRRTDRGAAHYARSSPNGRPPPSTRNTPSNATITPRRHRMRAASRSVCGPAEQREGPDHRHRVEKTLHGENRRSLPGGDCGVHALRDHRLEGSGKELGNDQSQQCKRYGGATQE